MRCADPSGEDAYGEGPHGSQPPVQQAEEGQDPSPAEQREIRLANTADSLFVKDNTTYFRFKLFVDASPEALAKILYVEYHLHEGTFDPPKRVGSDAQDKCGVAGYLAG